MQYDLNLTGPVGDWDFSSAEVDALLKKKADAPVTVLIDSLGGLLREGLSVAEAFRQHGDVTVHLRGMNASAATIATMGAKHVSMADSGLYLVHKCSTELIEWNLLNADQLRDKADELLRTAREQDKIDGMIAALYAKRCRKTPQELLALMAQDTWLTADEALTWGFIDEVTPTVAKPKLTETTATAMMAAGIPLPKQISITADNFADKLRSFLGNLFNLKNSIAMKEEKEIKNDTPEQPEAPEQPDTAALEERIAALETQAAELATRATNIEARLTALEEAAKTAPGDEQNHVVTTATQTKEDDETEAKTVFEAFAAARKMMGK